MEHILGFERLDRGALALVGGKNASLGEMIKSGVRVPPGFAVTTDSYLHFITHTGIKERIYEALAGLDPEDVESLDRASGKARGLIMGSSMTREGMDAIAGGYKTLCRDCNKDCLPVAVRSSATAEDLPTASFAGQQDTFLWVLGEDQVIGNVQACWASLFTPRAVSYRIRNKFSHEKVLISVGVQKMVNSRSAGVMFTLNPTNGDPSKVVIEASWGLGETVVSGSVNPDKFVVDKVMLEINERDISKKHIECLYDPDEKKVVNIEVEPERQQKCCLEGREVRELARLAKEIEVHYGCPMDIEWAIEEDASFPENIFIVQARPETVWSRKEAKPVIGAKSGYQLLMEKAMTRIKLRT